jgi:hypothetical protein
MLITRAFQGDHDFAVRGDPAWWHPAYDALLAKSRFPLEPLGTYISHITYGPIVVGQAPATASMGIALVHQPQIGAAGVDLARALVVPIGSAWDAPRARLRPGDMVMARSGVGSLGRGQLAVYPDETPAAVGSFVDLVRVEGLSSIYVVLYLKSMFGWSQIHRLLNGMATCNVSFAEIRALRIACLPSAEQARWHDAYLERVLPSHRAGEFSYARTAMRELVLSLETYLSGARRP